MDYLVSLIEAYPDGLPTITKLVKYIIQNQLTKNDLMVALALVKDIPRLKRVEKPRGEK